MEPIKEALTTSKFPAAMSNTATINSVRLPKVALSRPPSWGPTRIASWSVARPMRPARGTIASAEVMKVSNGWCVTSASSDTGTKTRSQLIEGRNNRAQPGIGLHYPVKIGASTTPHPAVGIALCRSGVSIAAVPLR